MKKFINKGAYFLGRIFGKNRNFISVICYHSFSKGSDKYSISPKMFKKQIERINKYHQFVGVKDFQNSLSGKPFKNGTLLTIDDGYADIEKILPLIKQYKIETLLFVMSEIKKADRRELNNKHKLLTYNQIKKLHKSGLNIGCHSATHADLSKLTRQDLIKEIVDSKKSLEKKLGFKINSFAYPKGIFTDKVLRVVKKAGYKYAFTTQKGTIKSKTNPLLIPRTVIDKSKSLSEFPYFFSESAFYLRTLIDKLGIWKIYMKLQREK